VNTINSIHEHITSVESGVFFTQDFKEYGSAEAVRVALHRLAKRGDLKRIAFGIYAKPKYIAWLGSANMPDTGTIAREIAERDQARIIPTGSMALYKLGLSTQVPLNVVYLTDGTPRKIKVGRNTILFKKAGLRYLKFKNETCLLAALALKEIGKEAYHSEDERQILKHLEDVPYEELKHDINLAPQWIAEVLAQALPY
jgi:hypothetical protein